MTPPLDPPAARIASRTLFAVLVIGSAALIILGVQPLLLGALVDEGRLTMSDLGRVATAEILMLAVGSSLGPRLVGGSAIRLRSLIVALLFIGAQLATILIDGAAGLMLARAVTGFLGGVLLGGVIAVITHAPDADRLYGLFYGVTTIPQAIAGYVLPTLIIPAYASAGGFGLLALLAAASAVAALLLRRPEGRHVEIAQRTASIWTVPVLVACLAVILQNAAVGAIWSYVDRIATDHGFSGETIGRAFSFSLMAQIAAGFAVAWAGSRITYGTALIGGLIVQAMLVAVIASTESPGIFIAVAVLFGFLWVGLLPYYIALMIDFDRSRHVAVLLFGVAIAGFSLGPFTASFVVTPVDAGPAASVAITFFLAAAAAYALSIMLHRRACPAGTDNALSS